MTDPESREDAELRARPGVRGDSAYADRIADLAARARRDRETFDPPENPPDEERAMGYLRDGLGPLVVLYLDARTADERVVFSASELARFHRATNTWLSLYAGCHGHDGEFDVAVRKAAEVLMQTENVRDTAQLLTRVSARAAGDDHTNS